MNEIGRKDVTALTPALGWNATGLTVTARVVADDSASPDDADCYGPVDKAAWAADQWQFVGVLVDVTDTAGRVWGSDSLWAVEYGSFPITDEHGTLVETVERDPLGNGTERETYPLREVMSEALADAATHLNAFLSAPASLSQVTP